LLTNAIRGTWYLSADGLGLRLHTGHAAEHSDRPVQHPQRAFDLDGEIDVSRRIDDVDPVVLPVAGGGGGRDRDAPLLLLAHPVHRGGAVVDLTELVGLARVEQDPLGRGRLAGIDVGHDADVADPLERCRAGHDFDLSPGAAPYQR